MLQERLLEAAQIQRENEARALGPRAGHSRPQFPWLRSWWRQLFSWQRADDTKRAPSQT